MNSDWLDGGWMHTISGKRFYPLNPRVEDVTLEDIAHALAHICRFGGHVQEHYSVAQHSLLVSLVCDPRDAAWGLMHDAAEAYVGDLIRPIKHQHGLETYREAEDAVQRAICKRFGLDPEMPASVRRADRIVLATEGRDVRELTDMDGLPEPRIETIKPWSAGNAKWAFLQRASDLWIS